MYRRWILGPEHASALARFSAEDAHDLEAGAEAKDAAAVLRAMIEAAKAAGIAA